jgi:aquaporin Z
MASSWRSITLDAQRVVAEFVGAFILAFVAALTAASAATGASCGAASPAAALAVGATYVALIFSLAHISRHGLFNPAVTLGSFLAGQLPPFLALTFVGVQALGATLGGVIGNAMRADTVLSCNPKNAGAAFAVEAIFTGALVLVSQNVLLQKHANEANSFFGIAVGFVVAAAASVTTPLSGGLFNPALGLALDFATLSTDPSTFNGARRRARAGSGRDPACEATRRS